MSLLPMTFMIGGDDGMSRELVCVRSIKDLRGKSALYCRKSDGAECHIVALPFDVIEKEIVHFYDHSESAYFDLTKERISAIRAENNLNKSPSSAEETTGDAAPELEVGTVMPDGTIYAGLSPDTGEALYALPHDAPLTMTWKKATEYAADFDAHGHKDWRLPTRDELKALFQNRHKGALKGTFNEGSGSDNAHWYWSCTAHPDNSSFVYSVNFTDGYVDWYFKDNCKLSVRPVRAEPRPGA